MVNFPRTEPKLLEIQLYLLNRKYVRRPTEKKKKKQEQQKTLSYSDMWSRIISSISKKIRWAKGSEITCREEKKQRTG